MTVSSSAGSARSTAASAANGWAQLLRIRDWPFRIASQTLRNLCEVDGRIVDRRADKTPVDIAMVQAGDVDGREVESIIDLNVVLNLKRPGEMIRLNIYRSNRKIELPVTLGEEG